MMAAVQEAPNVDPDVYPADLQDCEQWLTWKATDDGRKVPRAPYAHRDQVDRFVSAQDPDLWTDFAEASQWADRLPTHGLAFTIPTHDGRPDDPYVLVDYDDARDPATGAIHPTVREHLARADSYADVSTSGTGVHIVCRGSLPDDVKVIDAALPAHDDFPDAGVEVYDAGRYIAMTGRHIAGTPAETRPAQAFLDALVAETTETDAGEQRRAHGRDFVGPDADAAASILAAIRETHVAQAAGRYARNADDPASGATVFVHTSAVPSGFADCRVPGVEWTTTDAQQRIIERLHECERATAQALAAPLELSRRYVGKVLRRFADRGVITRREGAGPHGADVFVAGDGPPTGGADLTAAEITNPGVWDTDTWTLAIHPVALDDATPCASGEGTSATQNTALGAFGAEPPPS